MKRSRTLLVVAVILGVGLVVYGFVIRAHRLSALRELAKEQAVIPVEIIIAQPGKPTRSLSLPGTVRAWFEAPIFAQVSGYVTNWYQDYGASVKAGQSLATIDTPGLDADFAGAKARLRVAETRYRLAQTTAARYNNLLASHAVSQQDVDNQNANVEVMAANVKAAVAGVQGIQHQLAFRQVTAPFDGVVTARRVDVGDLVTAGGGTSTAAGTTVAGTTPAAGSSTELYQVSQTEVLRIYVTVPEQYSTEVLPGVAATINLASNPNDSVPGTLVRTSKAIDPSSLTLLAEIDVDNASGKLLPGGPAKRALDTLPVEVKDGRLRLTWTTYKLDISTQEPA